MTIGGRFTIAAIAIVAFALCDLVHEVIGHGLAVFFVPGVSAISLSSVALQTTGESRLLPQPAPWPTSSSAAPRWCAFINTVASHRLHTSCGCSVR